MRSDHNDGYFELLCHAWGASQEDSACSLEDSLMAVLGSRGVSDFGKEALLKAFDDSVEERVAPSSLMSWHACLAQVMHVMKRKAGSWIGPCNQETSASLKRMTFFSFCVFL